MERRDARVGCRGKVAGRLRGRQGQRGRCGEESQPEVRQASVPVRRVGGRDAPGGGALVGVGRGRRIPGRRGLGRIGVRVWVRVARLARA
ncbi:MAG: hypothetical protein LJF30_15460 [Acidobacteria bacterium]|nr:hypothetical protein [Acidobacteriota bacterium]